MRPSGAHGSYSKPHGELSPEALAAAGAEGHRGTLEDLDSLRSGAAGEFALYDDLKPGRDYDTH